MSADPPATRDCIVVGGGIVGLAVAVRLAARGVAVTLVEPGPLGGEASSAAAGMLAPQIEAHGPGPAADVGLVARARWHGFRGELAEATGVDLGWRARGGMALAATESDVPALAERARWQRDRGLRVELLDGGELRRLEPGLAPAAAALLFPDEAQVEPAQVVRALATAAARAGVTVVHSRAGALVVDGNRVIGVELERDRIACAQVVLAAGAWSGGIAGTTIARDFVRPQRGQLVELALPAPPVEHFVFAAGGYVVPRSDGRVVVGATGEDVGFVKQVTAGAVETLLARGRAVVPALAAARFARAWCGLRPATRDGLPLVGKTALDGLVLATGHFRNGILLAPLTADVVAALVCGEAPPVDVASFDPRRAAATA